MIFSGQSSNIQGSNIANCNPIAQNCNNQALHIASQNNCNPQTHNCNGANTRYISSTVIRNQQGTHDNRDTIGGYKYGYQHGIVGYNQNSKCNPQTDNCLSINTNQGVIYIPNAGVSQGVVPRPQCNPPTQNCGTQTISNGRIDSTSNLPKCSPGIQNCGQSYNQQSVPLYPPYSQGSQSSSSAHVSGCDLNTQNCGGGATQSNTYSSSGVHQGRYGTGQYGNSNYQYHATIGQSPGHGRSQISSGGVVRCPDGLQGLTKHPTDCRKFLNCAGGQTYIQDCAPGTLFNPTIGNCDYPNNVHCETSQTSSGVTESSWTHTQHGKSKEFYTDNPETLDKRKPEIPQTI